LTPSGLADSLYSNFTGIMKKPVTISGDAGKCPVFQEGFPAIGH
jgi:hypothetical protein